MRKRKLGKSILALTMAGVVSLAGVSNAAADGPGGTPPSGAPGGEAPGGAPGSSSSSSVSYAGATEVTSAQTLDSGTYASTTADQNALLINTSDAVTVNNPTVTKSGDSDGGDNCNFYGTNSGILVTGGSTTTITGGTISTTAAGANGVFSYGGNGGQNGAAGNGTTVNISDTKITTTGSNSGGIMTTGGGVTVAKNLTIETSGGSSAPIRTDRGGGTVTVTGGTYTSNGQGSPAIYSTADITVSDAALTSNASEGVCIEGKNSITLNNCNLTASNNTLNGNATFYDTIMIYQSQSGDAADGTSTFSMTGGSLTSKNGDVFHVTNTSAIINLNGVAITNTDSDNVLISVCDDGWSGASNIAVLNAANQTLKGDVLVGSDSTLTLNLSGSTSFVGKTSGEISNDKGSSVSTTIGTVNVAMSDNAVWTLTGDSTVSSLSGSGRINYNGYTLTVGSTKYTSGSPADGITETTETPADTTNTTTNNDTSDNSTTDNSSTNNDTSDNDTSDQSALKAVVFKNTSKTIKYAKVKKAAVSYSVIKESDGGKVTYQVTKGKAKYIKVSAKGKVTVKKGAKKGTYVMKIYVTAKGNYKETAKSVKVVVK